MKMIAVIGPGALGTLLAAHLWRTQPEGVVLLDHDESRAALLARQGLTVERDGETFTSMPATLHTAVAPRPDIGLICVKSHGVTGVLQRFGTLFGQDNLLIAMQNGIAHLDILAGYPGISWAVGVTSLGANIKAPGRVVHAGLGPTRLGFISPATPRARSLLAETVKMLCAAGFPTEISPDIRADIWAKLLVNIGINALTAINDCPNGAIADVPEYRQLMTEAVREAATVALAEKIPLPPEDPVEKTLAVCRATAANISSMLQDVRNKRLTEIAAINGALVALARRRGIPTPANETLIARVREKESQY